MKNSKVSHFYCDMYFENFYVFTGDSQEAMSEICKNIFDFELHKINFDCAGKLIEVENADMGRHGFLIWFPNADISNKQLAALCHESVHACTSTFKKRGIKLSYTNDEPAAYYTGWVFKKILDAVEAMKNEEPK